MYSPCRLLQSSLIAGLLLFAGNANVVVAEESRSSSVPQQSRELWDFMLFGWLLTMLGPPCTRPDGSNDWGKEGGPRWHHCSKKAKEDSGMEYSSYVEVSESSGNSDSDSQVQQESVSEYQGGDTANGGSFGGATGGFRLWMVFVAGSVLGAMVAVHMGQRKPGIIETRHEMSGAVMRRAGTVGAFAEGFFPADKAVEMSTSHDYKLDDGAMV